MAEPARASSRDVVDYELLFDCVHCGLCLEACPTYALTRTEMDSPRGRIYLMKALAEERIELDADIVRHLDLCLGCRGCETACPSGVHYGALIEKARDYVERVHRRKLADRIRRWAIGALFPYPKRMRLMLAPLAIIERAGLRPALQRMMPRALRGWMELLPPLSGHAGRSEQLNTSESIQIAGGAARSEQVNRRHGMPPRVTVHPGCVAQVIADSANRNSGKALEAAGYQIARMPEAACCGALDLHSGNRERARRFARANVSALSALGATAIVSAASGCATAMAEYGELLKDDPELATSAREVSAKVKDLSSLILEKSVPAGSGVNCTVTYHDACHLAHGLGMRESPRKLLQSIPGVRLIELAESDLCCGSAGSYNLTEPEMAHALAQRKVDNIIATGADYVVMANVGCQFQIAAELRRRRAKTRAIHLADFLMLASRRQPS